MQKLAIKRKMTEWEINITLIYKKKIKNLIENWAEDMNSQLTEKEVQIANKQMKKLHNLIRYQRDSN